MVLIARILFFFRGSQNQLYKYDITCTQCIQAVLHQDPEYVVRRFESGRYAVNTEVREIYLQAVELAEVTDRR